jgi:hypothetical protein
MKHYNLLIFLLVAATAAAQSKPPAKPSATVSYTVSLGGQADGNIPAATFKKIIDSALTVRDNKGNRYPVTRFRINYTFASYYTDSETQQKKTFKDFRASDFYDTDLLSDTWRGSIRDNAKAGDEVILNNIIIRLKDGKKLMVGNWRGVLK